MLLIKWALGLSPPCLFDARAPPCPPLALPRKSLTRLNYFLFLRCLRFGLQLLSARTSAAFFAFHLAETMARRTVNVVGQLGLARRADRSAAYSLAIAASICSRTSRPCRAGPWLGHPKWSRKAHRAGSSRAATTTHKKCPPLEGASGSGRAFFRRFVYTLRGRRRAQGTHGDNPIV